MLSLVYIDETVPCFNISFGWLYPGQSKIIRKKLLNNSSSTSALGVGIKVIQDAQNDAIINRGGLHVRLLGEEEWTFLGGQTDTLEIGDIEPYGEKVLEFRVSIPDGITDSQRIRYDIQLSVFYM
jgi:hypothetical protein